MFTEKFDVILASVLELEGKLPIFKTENLPMFNCCRTFLVHALFVFFFQPGYFTKI